MNHIENLTRYTANFIDELVCSGLRHVVISPGSRSTPLAMVCAEHEKMKEWILVDERSAAFFALGIAKKLQSPVALVCTSGTAAANYYPAIMEAYYARVPLIVLTADRPHELREVGASQTIQQIQMYGQYVKDFQEMMLPEGTEASLKYVRNRAARAVRIASQENQGPVHMNFPFREPLIPNLQLENLWGKRDTAYNPYSEGEKRLTEQSLEQIGQTLSSLGKGLLVCGPQMDRALISPLIRLSEKLQIPVLADPLSQLRAGTHFKGNIMTSYDAIFRNETVREGLEPDYIIRFGAMPVSKNYLFFVQEHANCIQWVVEHGENVREPTNHNSKYIFANGAQFCQDILPFVEKVQDDTWLKRWQEKEKIATEILAASTTEKITEGEAVRIVCDASLEEQDLFIANSMPVRDLDTFFRVNEKEIVVYANRGVSGIDGVVSSALGIAAVSKRRLTLVIGDLSFYHDLNGLLAAKKYDIPITIILINNDGGGIFSFLPQSKEQTHFEALFGTPLQIDFEKVVMMYEGDFKRITARDSLEKALQIAHKTSGLTVIEIVTDRKENADWHQSLWKKIEQRLLAADG